jgi:hypothetical protein
MSFIDPYSMWKEIATAAVKSGDVKQGVIDGVVAWGKPFVSQELGTKLLMNLWAGVDADTKSQIYDENDEWGNIAIDMINYVWEKGVKPGTWKAAEKIGKDGRSPGREIANTFFGVRIQNIDLEKTLAFKAKEYSMAVQNAKKAYNKYRYNPKSTEEERVAGLERSNIIYKKLFDKFQNEISSANYYIGDSDMIMRILKDTGLSTKKAQKILLNDFEGFKDEPIYNEGGEKIPEYKKSESSDPFPPLKGMKGVVKGAF